MILNHVTISGNLVKEPAMKEYGQGEKLVNLRLAHNGMPKKGESKGKATFVDCTFFGKQADVAMKFLTKGSPLIVEGRLEMESWTDRASGQEVTKLEIKGERLHLFPSTGRSERDVEGGAAGGGQGGNGGPGGQDDRPAWA